MENTENETVNDKSSLIPQNILVMQQRQLGDVVVTTSIFAALKKLFPHSKLGFFTEEKCFPIVQHDPYIDEFIILEKSANTPWFKQWQTYWQARQKGYDTLVDLQQLPRCQLLTFFSKAKNRITFSPRHEYRKLLYTHYPVPENPSKFASHEKIDMLAPLLSYAPHIQNIEDLYSRPKLYLLDEEIQESKTLLSSLGIKDNEEFLTLDATHKHFWRRWAKYPALMQKILDTYPNLKIFLLRAPGEEDQLTELLSLNPARIVMPERAPNIRISMAVIAQASIHVGNTSAPNNMAIALNIPCLTVVSHVLPRWHYAPRTPSRGEAKHVEVRVNNECIQMYYKNTPSEEQEKNRLERHHPELFLINEEQAFNAFKQLYENAYY